MMGLTLEHWQIVHVLFLGRKLLNFRLVFAIAIISVLFSIGFSFDAFAAVANCTTNPTQHPDCQQGTYPNTNAYPTPAPPYPPIPSWKSAYMFDCSGGNGKGKWGGPDGGWTDTRKFVLDNNGWYHACGFNWINQAPPSPVHGELGRGPDWPNDNGHMDGGFPCKHIGCYFDTPVSHAIGRNHPQAWGLIINSFNTAIADLKTRGLGDSENSKLILRGASWGGGAVTMMATNTAHKIDLVYLIDPVGTSGNRHPLVKNCGISAENILYDVGCQRPFNDRIFETHVTKVYNSYQNHGPLPYDAGQGHTFFDPYSLQ